LRLARRGFAADPAPGTLDVVVLLAEGDARRASDWNAVWDAARRIRRDEAFDRLVYVIASGAPDAMLMNMVANARDPGNPAFDASQPAGLYLPVRTEYDLGAAFAAVAAGIARATQ
jgi:hypothetical protein